MDLMSKGEHTVNLTAAEIAFKRKVAIRDDLQRATLAAEIRTGKRIGCSVGQARGAPKNPPGKPFNVDLIAYRLGRNGEPTGASKVITLKTGLSAAEATEFLDGWTADQADGIQ